MSEGAWNEPADRAASEAQMRRPLDGRSRVVSRCALGLPVVHEVFPELSGQPFPTLYYLTCPLARARLSRLEAAGAVREWTERVEAEPELAAALAAAHHDYAARRARLLSPEDPLLEKLAGGVGGSRGVKCLHAHYAHARAGGQNPIGSVIRGQVEPLDCTGPCVAEAGERWRPVSAWVEPVR